MPAGVVLPTSLLDALLRSVPAASVPPLLTATLLTPFLTADYATSLLRERCALDAAPVNDSMNTLRLHCAWTASSVGAAFTHHGHLIEAALRPLCHDEATDIFRNPGIGRSGAARLSDNASPNAYVSDSAVARYSDAAAAQAVRSLMVSRTQRTSTVPKASIADAVVRLPPYTAVDGARHHGQVEVTATHAMVRTVLPFGASAQRVFQQDRGAHEFRVRCRSWVLPKHSSKRPRTAADGQECSVWQPRDITDRSEVFVVSSVRSECTAPSPWVRQMLQGFVDQTALARLFDPRIIIHLAMACSQVSDVNTPDTFVSMPDAAQLPLPLRDRLPLSRFVRASVADEDEDA